MSWVDGLRERLRMVLRRSEAEREIAEEFEFHLERETEKNLAAGMSPEEARRAARLRFGGEDRYREQVRDAWSGVLFAGVGQDLRLGVRRLVRSPAFTAVAVATLALGIGANTAMFSLVRSVLLEPLPYTQPDRLVMIWHPSADQTRDTWLSAREVLEYRRATESFERLAAYTRFNANLTEGEPERVHAGAVTANAFATLGVGALHGRTFTAEEDRPGDDDVVVLGHGLWQRRFGGAADVVGRTIRVNGRSRTVVGVMPPDFRLPLDYREARPTELWVPAAIDPSAALRWGDRSYFILGRLAPDVGLQRANADLDRALARWIDQGHLDESVRDWPRAAVPFAELILGSVRPALLILFGAVGVILLIVCANVAHLLLARSDAHRRQIATQAALGAGRLRLVRQVLVESGMLAALGAVLGLACAWGGLRAGLALAPANVIRLRSATLDVEVLVFAALLALATMILAGLVPALRLSRVDIAGVMSASRGEGAAARRGVRRALVIGEVAVALVLVIGAALLARSFAELRTIDLGFDSADAVTLRIDLPRTDDPEPERVIDFYRTLLDRVERIPRVRSAGAARRLPLAGTIGDWTITLEDDEPGDYVPADWQIVTPGYFESMGIELVRGRFIGDADDERGPMAAVVNETMAERYWPGRDALGERFHLGTLNQPWIEIVGVTRDVRHNAIVEDPRAEMYLPHAQWRRAKGGGSAQYGMTLVVRTDGVDPLSIVPAVREQVWALDPSLPIAEVRTLDAVVDAALAQPRFTALLLSTLALLALALAAIGLYGVVAFMATRRTKEIGVRVALGARRADVFRLIIREAAAITGVGLLIGVGAAFGATRLLAGLLYGVSATDPASFATVAALLAAVALLASYLPARRAARTDPMAVLREE